MRKTIAFLTILATSLASYAASAQPEGAPPAAPPPEGVPPAAPPPEGAPPAAAPAPAAAPESKIQVGVAFLPMLVGKVKYSIGSNDLRFAYGVGLTAGYAVIPGLSVGIAPQFIFGVRPDVAGFPSDSAKEIDIMARIAYAYHVIPKLSVGVEVLPGYSIITIPDSWNGNVHMDNPKGFVIAFGAGAAYDITDMFFANVGIGYQMGFQSNSVADYKTSFLRIAVGGGVKF